MKQTTFGGYIKELREGFGWSQSDLAREVGVKPAHISQIETRPSYLPRPDLRRRLARALGVRHVDLLVVAGELLPQEIEPGETGSGDAEIEGIVRHLRRTMDALTADDRWYLGRFLQTKDEARGRAAAHTERDRAYPSVDQPPAQIESPRDRAPDAR